MHRILSITLICVLRVIYCLFWCCQRCWRKPHTRNHCTCPVSCGIALLAASIAYDAASAVVTCGMKAAEVVDRYVVFVYRCCMLTSGE